jgi:hypothetical protein
MYHPRHSGTSNETKFGGMTLGDIRMKFQDNQDEMEKLKGEVVRRREQEKLGELRHLKIKSQEMLLKRDAEQAEITRLMSDMEAKRVAELQARLERERVKKQLQDIDRSQLRQLEDEKKRYDSFHLVTS